MKKKNYLIYGFEKSGQSAFELLKKKKKSINLYIYDNNPSVLQYAIEITQNVKNVFVLKNLDKNIIKQVDVVVLSPGVSIYNPFVVYAKSLKKKVISELELGYTFCKKKIIAITGTNGKTTTTSLITHILNVANKKAISVGNIGLPLSRAVLNFSNKKFFVCEVSSFQLEAIENFKPKISCLLNITPDHINRHKSMHNYAKTKKRIFINQKRDDFFVFNQKLKLNTSNKPFKCLSFGFKALDNCCFKSDSCIYYRPKNKLIKICNATDYNLIGVHNIENILCAITVAKILKVKNKHIVEALKSFKLSEHRLQKVFSKGQVDFYDDSKATNIDATVCAVNSFSQNIILILGGSDKGYNYQMLFEKLPKNITKVLCCGQVGKKLMADAKRYNKDAVLFKTLKEATCFACKVATPNCCVLLSPASASFDEFKNYKHRGEMFLKYIKDFYGEENS